MTPPLALRDVAFAFPGRPPVLTRASLNVPAARTTIVMGANGSGKTTLLRIAAGLLRPQRGSALAGDGRPAGAALRDGRIGYVPQQLGLVRSASVLDNVLLGGSHAIGARSLLGLYPADVVDRAQAALDLVGLREKAERAARDLSGGERQRVAIARTLVQKPDVIVADELIASLDALQAHAVMGVVRDLRAEGVAILLALHQIDVALAHADHLHFLARGELTHARPDELTLEEARSALTA